MFPANPDLDMMAGYGSPADMLGEVIPFPMPEPVITPEMMRVVQMEPGPMPTLMASAPASMSALAPFTAGTPKLSAAWPDRKLTMPTLNSCACTGADRPTANSAAATDDGSTACTFARRRSPVDVTRRACSLGDCFMVSSWLGISLEQG